MTTKLSTRLLMLNYALTTLLSALLLFQVQPIISKYILPWFGGSPAVWTTCMVCFQTMLFAGYAYAHLLVKVLRPRWQAVVHVSLLVAAVCVLPIAPDVAWKLDTGTGPTLRILGLLSVAVGLPYFALSATGPLVQAWFSRTFANRSPYRLFALSNAGSLVGLLGYPFFVEPRFALAEQTWYWGLGFVAFAALCGLAVLAASWARRPPSLSEGTVELAADVPPRWQQRAAWLLLPALASTMLLATTNHVCQDVAVMPFLWVAPLSLYLISFIISFDHPRWYLRKACSVAALASLGAVAAVDQLITGGSGVAFSFVQELVLHFAALFFLCMVCHGELFRLRPHPNYLTSFYLMISAGGAIGGLFVSLMAPHLFTTFAEWRYGLLLGCLLAAWVLIDSREPSFLRRHFAAISVGLFVVLVVLKEGPLMRAAAGDALHESARNFYGVISVLEREVDDPDRHVFNFYSGRIVHGLQFADAEKRREPTAYFGRSTGVGQTLASLDDRSDLRVGVVGLGVGTLAVYAQPGQYFRFYELNDDVQRFAEKYFTYLADCRGQYDVVLGDGRLSLEQEPAQQFDLLILDAFSGDAVPTHLLTKEAFEIYERHLRPEAPVAVNISNRYLDLSPVVAGLADAFGFDAKRVSSPGDSARGEFPAEWMVLTRPGDSDVAQVKTASSTVGSGLQRTILWTDDHSNLFEILK